MFCCFRLHRWSRLDSTVIATNFGLWWIRHRNTAKYRLISCCLENLFSESSWGKHCAKIVAAHVQCPKEIVSYYFFALLHCTIRMETLPTRETPVNNEQSLPSKYHQLFYKKYVVGSCPSDIYFSMATYLLAQITITITFIPSQVIQPFYIFGFLNFLNLY